MSLYLNITFRTFTIWIMAAIINGLLCGIYMNVSERDHGPIAELIFGAGLFSLLFAIPGIFFFWLIMLRMVYKKVYGRALFRAALSAGIIISLITVCLFRNLWNKKDFPFISGFIILSAIASIMMHFNLFKKITAINNYQQIT